MNRRSVCSQLKSSDGAEIAEAALVLPLVFMFIFGIIWFGRAFNIYSTIQQAAQQGAVVAARSTCATCGNAPPLPAAIESAVLAVMHASSIDSSQIFDPGAAPTGCILTTNHITVCQQVLLNPSSNTPPIQSCGSPPAPTPSQICGAVVTFQYPFTFNFPGTSINLRQILMTAQAQTRREN